MAVMRLPLSIVLLALPVTATGTPFETVDIFGDTNLTSGSLSNEDGETVASGAVGLFVATKAQAAKPLLEFSIAFSFGDEGSTISTPTKAEYVAFLQAPSSSLGGFVRARALSREYSDAVRVGPSLVLRANAVTLDASENDQKLSFVAIDPAAALSVIIDKTREISVAAEIGLSLRFWNKPKGDFREELGIDHNHVYFGPRITAALEIGDVHVGLELTRFWGGGLADYKEFTILPYVGLRGGLNLKDPPPNQDAAAGAPSIL